MPIPNVASNDISKSESNGKGYLVPIILVTSLFFLWGIANSLNGTLIKHFQTALDLDRALAGVVDSAFYAGYFVMALPAAFLMNRIGYKKGILIGLFLFALGALLFYPSAELRSYAFFLFSLFTIACGLAFLETAANPYITVLGNPETGVRRINLSQSFNGLGAILGPIIGGLFIFSERETSNSMLEAMPHDQAEAIRIAEAHSVQMPYLIIAGVVLVVALLIYLTNMPEIGSKDESHASLKGIFRHRHLLMGVIAQFCYCGAQTSIWGYFVDLKLHFARTDHLKVVEMLYRVSSEMSPTQIASFHASFAFVLFMAGRFVGTALLTQFKANRLLALYATICFGLLTYSWLGEGLSAVIAIMLTYFFMSIMFPTIFSLSIQHLGKQVKLGSGLVIMAIVGGAVLPPLSGLLSRTGVENALIIPVLCFLVILYFGLKGYKTANS